MAIIRNERQVRETPAQEEIDSEEEIDYSWHPSEEEFTSPLSAEQWEKLLSDPSFADSDAARAVKCLREYGEPATFQQLSIRYRGTMGRYRRWLGEAAQAAGERYGLEAPQKDQFGMDEWWPLLYLTRNTGKPGAGVFEMQLRPEVDAAFELIAEKERQAKRAENARNLKRIEQLERARQEERKRLAAAADKSEIAGDAVPSAVQPASVDATSQVLLDSAAQATDTAEAPVQSAVVIHAAAPAQNVQEDPAVAFPKTKAFLDLVQGDTSIGGGARFVASLVGNFDATLDAATPLDYALRYAERLRHVFQRMCEGLPSLTLAAIARELGDESVERLQKVCNGQEIPEFTYLDTLRDKLFVNIDRLEAIDGREDGLPAFITLHKLFGTAGALELLVSEPPREIAYVVDDSTARRTGVVVRYSDLRCALLTTVAVEGSARPRESELLGAFIAMVDELDGYARVKGIERTSRQVSAKDWDRVASGDAWPGTLLH